MSRVALMKMAIKACFLGMLAALATRAVVAQASENSATFEAAEQATETVTPTETPAPTASDTPTATPSHTQTPPATSTASPTITGTPPTATPPPAPNMAFLFALSASQAPNECAFNLAANLGLFGAEKAFQTIADSDAATLRNTYKVIYVAPGLNSDDYRLLQKMVTQGTIEQFVSSGGVAVINAAGTLGDQPDIAPDGVGFLFSATGHDSETIEASSHPYIAGTSFGGDALGSADFDDWKPTDRGTLTDLPEGTTVVLTNSDGTSWAEYRHGAGRVIVTTLTYCTSAEPNSQGAAARNLLLYSSFFKGSAFTPLPTVTLGPRPTPSKTASPSRTPTASATASATPTTTLTSVPSPSASSTPEVSTPTPTALPTSTPTFSVGGTTTPTDTATPTASETPSETATSTATATMIASATPPEAPTATATELASATPSPAASTTLTPTTTEPPTPTPTTTAVTVSCTGDCNKDHVVTVDEVLVLVQIALGNDAITACDQGDVNGDGKVTVDEILMAVSSALNGCPSDAPPT